jgi:hypothetical protein
MFDVAASSSESEEMATEEHKINRLVAHRVIAGEAKYLVRTAAAFACLAVAFFCCSHMGVCAFSRYMLLCYSCLA